MKDVLFMSQYFYPEYVSSAVLPYETARRLSDAGYEVGSLCGYPFEYSKGKDVPMEETAGGISIKRLKYIGASRKGAFGRLINFISFFLAVYFHLGIAKQYKTIIVYSDPPILPLLSVIAKRRYGTKVIFVCYDIYPEIGINSGSFSEGGLISKGFNWINRRVYKNLDAAIALSTDMKSFVAANRQIESSKIHIIHNWGDDKDLVPQTEDELFGIPKGAYVVSYLGNLGVCQDADTLLDAMEKLKDHSEIHFVIAGHGSKMDEVQNAIKEKDLSNVHYFGFLHGKDYEAVLARSNAFALSLVKGMAGLCSPSKVCNYLRSGKPVFFIGEDDLEVAAQIESEGCGFCTANGDGRGLAETILSLAADKELQKSFGANARELYDREYSRTVCLDRYADLIKDLIG